MKKLTQKEYVEELKTCSKFICAIHGRILEEVVKGIDECGYGVISSAPTYKFVSFKKRSKDFKFIKEDGSHVYRDWYGKNRFFTHKQILIHENVQDGHTTIFINC